MSLDKPRSAKDIRTEIATRETNMTKRLGLAELSVKDKKTEAKLARSLKLRGTSEGTDAVKKAVHAAAQETDKEHKQKDAQLKQEVFDKAAKTEQELKERAGTAKADAAEARKASSQMDTKSAKGQVEAAERAASQDQQLLEKEQKAQEKSRKKGEAAMGKQRDELKAAKPTFRG
jgi:hypothetical protein